MSRFSRDPYARNTKRKLSPAVTISDDDDELRGPLQIKHPHPKSVKHSAYTGRSNVQHVRKRDRHQSYANRQDYYPASTHHSKHHPYPSRYEGNRKHSQYKTDYNPARSNKDSSAKHDYNYGKYERKRHYSPHKMRETDRKEARHRDQRYMHGDKEAQEHKMRQKDQELRYKEEKRRHREREQERNYKMESRFGHAEKWKEERVKTGRERRREIERSRDRRGKTPPKAYRLGKRLKSTVVISSDDSSSGPELLRNSGSEEDPVSQKGKDRHRHYKQHYHRSSDIRDKKEGEHKLKKETSPDDSSDKMSTSEEEEKEEQQNSSSGEEDDIEEVEDEDEDSDDESETEEEEEEETTVEEEDSDDESKNEEVIVKKSKVAEKDKTTTIQSKTERKEEMIRAGKQGNQHQTSTRKEKSPTFVEPAPISKYDPVSEPASVTKSASVSKTASKSKIKVYYPAIQGCRSVDVYKCLNKIEEGAYGIVYRAEDKQTKEIVALKLLKIEREKDGFPITSLREINTLLKSRHPNIVAVKEIVVGSNMDKVYLVMEYVEHDLKSLMETMKRKNSSFLTAEVKCLMIQLLSAIAHLHDNWILHRDLKTSNLLFSHNGILKVGDFGLAREYGSPLKSYTSVVVTLWYRAPELLLGTKLYSTPIDMWAIGCIFAELLCMKALLPGRSEIDQVNLIFKTLGTPTEKQWPAYKTLPLMKKINFAQYPAGELRTKVPAHILSDTGFDLLSKFLAFNPKERISAESALEHQYFAEHPMAIDPEMFPTWPAKSDPGSYLSVKGGSPKAPCGGKGCKDLGEDEGFYIGIGERGNPLGMNINAPSTFCLKF